jgi:hypothetical protein
MGEFDLQHAFACRRALAEDFEDQPGAVQHLGAGFCFEIALLDGGETGIHQQQLDLFGLHPRRERFRVTTANEGRRLYFADLDDFGEHDVEPDGPRQALKLSLASINGVLRKLTAHIGHDKTGARRLRTLVDKRLWAAPLDGLFVFKLGQIAACQSLSWFCSGSNS